MLPHENHNFNLSNLKKEQPFKVPENYFDSLGARITDHVQANTTIKEESVFSLSKLRSMIVFAGGFAGLAIIIYMGVSFFFTKIELKENHSESEIASISEYTIVSGLDETTIIENLYQEASATEDSTSHFENNEKIIDYLMKENIDISTIIDEL